MARLNLFAIPVALALLVLPAVAQEVEHYTPIPSETLSEALENLASHNAKVADVLAREDMGVADMGEIHQYSCTMEQAVARIAASKDEIAVILEEVHLASKGGDVEALREKAAAYLARTAPLTA